MMDTLTDTNKIITEGSNTLDNKKASNMKQPNVLVDYLKVKLIKNSKNPSSKWKHHPENQRTDFVPCKLYNVSIISGKKNNLICIDLDTYRWKNDHPLLKHLKINGLESLTQTIINEYDTYTVNTSSGGLQFSKRVEWGRYEFV